MKTLVFVSLFLLFQGYVCTHAMAQQHGIQFFDGTWSEALHAAKTSDKLVFVDVYTDWCPPCKEMDRYVLPLPEVGERYNAAFISIKLDAEKGAGPTLAAQYEVDAYPTYLYLDADGNLLHRAVGYFEPETFIAHADLATASAGGDQTLGMFGAAFEKGERTRDFLRSYMQKMKALGIDNSEVMNAYFSQLEWRELNDPKEWQFLGHQINGTTNDALVFLLQHMDVMDDTTREELTPKLFSLLIDAAGEATGANDPLMAKQALSLAEPLLPHLDEREHRHFYRYSLHHAKAVRDIEGLKRSGTALVDGLMDIPTDIIKAEDAKRFNAIMEPFLNGDQDSTRVEGFQQEKAFIKNIYSREICSYLYEVANVYADILPDSAPELRSALAWAVRCEELLPGTPAFETLTQKLRERVRTDGDGVRQFRNPIGLNSKPYSYFINTMDTVWHRHP